MSLSTAEKIRIAISRQGATVTSLAPATGQTRQNLSNKLSRDNFTTSELRELAEALGVEFVCGFRFPDGQEI